MPTIDEVLQQEENPAAAPDQEVHAQPVSTTSFFDFIRKPTGDGPVEDYIHHPLNFDSSTGTAKIVRGITGAFGALNWWIIDVVFGLLEFWKPKKPIDITPPPGPEPGSGGSE